MKQLATCLASAILASGMTMWLLDGRSSETANAQQRGPVFPKTKQPSRQRSAPKIARRGMTDEEAVNVAVYKQVNRSVVNITTQSAENYFLLEGVSQGSGSGCVLDQRGHILTNFHVIEDVRKAGVTLSNGKTYEAKLVGADRINDIAVLKIDAPKEALFPVSIGDSSGLQVGMRVFAIGNPFGLERTMTTGIISSLNRSLKVRAGRTIRSIIQIDAAVNPGNSGGPLLDTRGRVIGINVAIASRTGQSSGVGFAIPSNLISRVVPQLIRHGRVIRPEIGITRVYETEEGLRIAALRPRGPAAAAGLRGPKVVRTRRGLFVIERIDRSAADLIVAVDGKKVKTADDFLAQIESNRPGDTISVTVIRDGKCRSVNVKLAAGR